MNLEIEYAEVIVGATVHNNILKWYIAPKEYFIMDYVKYGIAKEKRFGIEILSEKNKLEFIQGMETFEVEKEKLNELISELLIKEDFDKIEEYIPNIIINFDVKELVSMYPEMVSFEQYVPVNWVGRYTNNILNEIDKKYKYWYFDEKNIFEL